MMRAIKINKIFKAVFDEFVYGGHMLAFGLVGIVITSAILLSIQITWDFLAIIYLFTLAACLFGRYLGLKGDMPTNPKRSGYLSRKYNTLIFRIVSLVIIGSGIILYYGKYTILALCIAMLILSFIYDSHIKKFTRKIVGLKNIFISFLFCLVVALLIVYYSSPISFAFLLVELFVFIMLLIGTSFSDIKDIESDKSEGLKTFAVVFGAKKLVSVLYIVNILAGVPILIGVIFGFFPQFSITLLLALFYNLIYFNEASKKNVNFEFLINVVLDSQFILWPGFILIGKLL